MRGSRRSAGARARASNAAHPRGGSGAPSGAAEREPRAVVLLGAVSLAVAMGVGRFAFTPLLPLMVRDGVLDASVGAEWAAANYAGYLLGALSAVWFGRATRLGLLLGLGGVTVTTLAIGALQGELLAYGGPALRGAAGVFSAWTLVCASSLCLAALARCGRNGLGAWIYTGVGVGIAATGAMAWLGGSQSARALWFELGILAIAGSLFAWARAPGDRRAARTVPPAPERAAASPDRGSVAAVPRTDTPGVAPVLVLCYGTFGFGYIVPATFLPELARRQVDDPLVFGLTWPLFGLAAALSVAAAARWLPHWPRRRVWALAQGVMALGTALPLCSRAIGALAVSAVLVGGTFMVATMAGLQAAREAAPDDPTPLLARMTMAFAAGQIAGPVLVRAVGARAPAGMDAFALASLVASALLVVTAAWLLHGSRPARA